MYHHVHLISSGRGYNLRIGLFRSFVGWQTAEAARLPVKTRDAAGREITRCLDGLSRPVAEDLARRLDDWLVLQGFELGVNKRPSAKQRKLDPIKLKYEEAMKAK